MPRSVLCYETSQNYLGEQKEKFYLYPIYFRLSSVIRDM